VPFARQKLVAALLAVAWCVAATAAPVIAEDTPTSDPQFIWPTSGRLTQNYGCTGFWAEPRRGSCAHFHGGIDIGNSRGTPIRAAADGIISHVGLDPWLTRNRSWMVIINHGAGLQTMYAHLRDREMEGIRRGARVEQGQVIGLMDMTGMATGPHLHFSFISNGSWVNPRDYIDGLPQRSKPRGSTIVQQATCFNFGAGFGAYNGQLIAMPLEFDGPPTCAA
jgi:murein DD-endopeptidase MepM/ murein hydrolase activator NlpD